MIKCIIDKIDGYVYHLSSSRGTYIINIEFYGVSPKEQDTIYLSQGSLQEKALNIGLIDSKYGRNIKADDDEDLVVLVSKDNKYILKRVYG